MTNLEKLWASAAPKQKASAVCVLLRDDCTKCPLHKKSCVFDDVKAALVDWAENHPE